MIAHQRSATAPDARSKVLPTNWDEICRSHDIRGDSRWFKLTCSVDHFRPIERTTLRVGPVGPDDVDAWARTTLRGFGMPVEGLAEMFAASASNPTFRPFAAWDGDEIVATANLFVDGEVASLNAGATLPSHQNRGAQSALIAARGKHAIAAGCRWLVAETGEPAEGAVNPSLNNLVRAGLTTAVRPTERGSGIQVGSGVSTDAPARFRADERRHQVLGSSPQLIVLQWPTIRRR